MADTRFRPGKENEMKTRSVTPRALLVFTLFILLMTAACASPARRATSTKTALRPTTTRRPTLAPTPTATPQPLSASFVIDVCPSLSASKNPVTVTGKIRTSATSLCLNNRCNLRLLDDQYLTVKLSLGTGPNTMDKLPMSYSDKDLMIRAFDGQVVKHNYTVRLTGIIEYTKLPTPTPDSKVTPEPDAVGLCSLIVTRIESLMSPEALEPENMSIAEAEENCADLEERQQIVRIRGKLQLHYPVQLCSGGTCSLSFYDSSASITAKVRTGGGPNSMSPLPKNWSLSDLKVRDKNGSLVPPEFVTLTGLLSERDKTCTLTVDEIE